MSPVTSEFHLDETYVAVRNVTLSWVRLGWVTSRLVKSSLRYFKSGSVHFRSVKVTSRSTKFREVKVKVKSKKVKK